MSDAEPTWMRCTRIYFQGFKRLASTNCNVSPRILALVGVNEAGKTSVLQGLEWLTEDEPTPRATEHRSRANKTSAGWVVAALFDLSRDDVALLEDLDFAKTPSQLLLSKQVDGQLIVSFRSPDEPRRNPAPFQEAKRQLEGSRKRLEKQYRQADSLDPERGSEGRPDAIYDRLREILSDPERAWTEDDRWDADALADWMEYVPQGWKTQRAPACAKLLRDAEGVGAAAHPREVGLELLTPRVPKFISFDELNRLLPTRTPIDRAGRANLPLAIANILAIAGVDPKALAEAQADPTSGDAATIVRKGNRRLDAYFGQAWNQSDVSIHIGVDDSGLLTHVYSSSDDRYTSLEERSDGLRAFIALAAFLKAQNLDVPPILLIDEAERHLHLDAQADLVSVLMPQIEATQIIYSTHSPGCLPADLGTGIRLVERTSEDRSDLKSDFWTNEPPGFSSLLFAMGASAAAFSSFRRAVLAEGATEMILLPTLLRKVAGSEEVDYQVAPGLAVRRSDDFAVEEIASKVVYLADGDADGTKYIDELRDAGVNPDRLFNLPTGTATEDLLDTEFYLSIVSSFLPEDAPRPDKSLAKATQPIARSLDIWAASHDIKLPGKVAVAYQVLEQDEIILAPGAARTLSDLHRGFIDAFESPPRPQVQAEQPEDASST